MSAPSSHNPTTSSTTSRYLPLMLILFIGSGCAALIYEIVWYQMLQLVIGLTTISLGLLLGSFMGGMCLGSLALSRLVRRGRHPLRVYACLELGVGLLGLLELWLVPAVGAFYTDHSAGHDYWNIVARGLVAAVCLVPPTLLMGATLPAIARWVETTPTGVSWLGFFYGGNIAGAVFGCLLAGFYLLRVHDMVTATCVAAAINVIVALLAYALASDNVMPPEPLPSRRVPTAPGGWAIYMSIALSGLTALGAEVIWTRLLSLILGGTVYTFSIILAVFLFGLGIGSSLGSFAARSRMPPRVALGVCQMLLIAGVAWASFNISHSLPHWPIDPSLAGSLKATSDHLDGAWYIFQLDLVMTMWTILPAAMLWGASFPLALAAVAAPGQDPGRLVGGVYAANTVGAIVGALFFSIASVPLWGTQTSQRLLIGFAALSTFVTLAPLALARFTPWTPADAQGRARIPALGAAGLLVMTLIAAPVLGYTVSPANWGTMAYGRFVATYQGEMEPDITPEADVPQNDGSSSIFCTYTGEGLNGTVAVTMTTAGIRSFHSAGKVQASNDPRDMRLQRMLGHISALTTVKPPENVLVVACGAGVTAGTFLMHPSVKNITICDIEPLVPKYVTPMFTKENYGITDNVVNQNPRIVHTPVGDKTVTVVYDDGRHFIRTTKEKFDVITSDPIDPWVKGCAALNTVEYYTMCKEHLNPGGVMSLWIPFYESNDASAKSVLGTFFKVFPNGILWSNDMTGDGYDAVLFAQVEPTKINIDDLQARLDSAPYAAVKQSLAEAGFPTLLDLLGTYAGRAVDLGDWLEGAQINEDRNLRLQYIAGLAYNTYDGPGILRRILNHYKFPTDMFTGSHDSILNVKQAIEDPRQMHTVSQAAPPPPALAKQ
jgi:spermidine synthase